MKNVQFSAGFLLLCAWLLYTDHSGIVLQGLFACFLHELGHCLALYFFGIDRKQITFTCYGAEIKIEKTLSYTKELVTASAGPAVNLILALLCCRFPFGMEFAGINLSLAIFNLLPVGQLDGARILRCTAGLLLHEAKGYRFCQWISLFVSAIFLLFGLYTAFLLRNPTLLLMCFWILKSSLLENLLKI